MSIETVASIAQPAQPAMGAGKARSSTIKHSDSAEPDGVTLDWQAFPHIFDLILENAPHGSLLALRAANKELRDRVDGVLVQHVVIRPGPLELEEHEQQATDLELPAGPGEPPSCKLTGAWYTGHRCRLESSLGRIPGLRWDFNHMWQSWDKSCSKFCRQERQRWKALFARTKVIDFHNYRQPPFWGRQIEPFPNPDLVMRTFANNEDLVSLIGVNTPNIVYFTDFSPLHESEWLDETGCEQLTLCSDRIRRIVTHVRYDVRRPTLNNCWLRIPNDGPISEIVFILEKGESPRRPAGSESTVEAWMSDSIPETQRVNPAWKSGEGQAPHGWLSELVSLAYFQWPTMFTVVGATEVPFMCVGLAADIADPQEKVETFYQNMIDWINSENRKLASEAADEFVPAPPPYEPLSIERQNDIRRRITFYTRAEYRALVGEEQWRMETIPTPGGPAFSEPKSADEYDLSESSKL